MIDFRISGHAAKASTADVTKQNVWKEVGRRDARQTDANNATLNDSAFWTLRARENECAPFERCSGCLHRCFRSVIVEDQMGEHHQCTHGVDGIRTDRFRQRKHHWRDGQTKKWKDQKFFPIISH